MANACLDLAICLDFIQFLFELVGFIFAGVYLSIEYVLADVCGVKACRAGRVKRQLEEKRTQRSDLMGRSDALTAEIEALQREIKSAEENPDLD